MCIQNRHTQKYMIHFETTIIGIKSQGVFVLNGYSKKSKNPDKKAYVLQ